MPGKPSSSWPCMQSPTGCTKQLINVAWMSVPAALMMRPAPIAPACRLARNRASHRLRRFGASTAPHGPGPPRERTRGAVCTGLGGVNRRQGPRHGLVEHLRRGFTGLEVFLAQHILADGLQAEVGTGLGFALHGGRWFGVHS